MSGVPFHSPSAARNATASEVAGLQQALEANKAAIGDKALFIVTDIAFHLELAKIAHNVIFLALHDQISEWLREQRVVTLTASDQEEIAYSAHDAIYKAVAARDQDGAEDAMRAHMEQLASTFWLQRNNEFTD